MPKFNRRHFLLGGVAAGTATTVGTEYVRRKRAAARQAALEALMEQYYNPQDVLEAALTGDVQMVSAMKAVQDSARFPQPQIPYSREISKRLILCSRLATQQYLTGRNETLYKGDLRRLPEYNASLDRYELVASFRGLESEVKDTVKLQLPQEVADDPTLVDRPTPLEDNFSDAGNAIRSGVSEIVQIQRKVPVFYGFVLKSASDSIVVFRGTQRTAEWISNLYAFQEDYFNPTTKARMGRIHRGFRRIADSIIDPLPQDVARQLDPTKPCYVSGHSLGGALATLVGLKIALMVPQLRPQMQVYAYASPRIGDPEFARSYAQVLPNSFRIANLADPIPMMPPTKARDEYVHVGEEWAFVTQTGDILPNHIVDTYRQAINAEAETNQARNHSLSGPV